jgi:Tol biopolymer transport system component
LSAALRGLVRAKLFLCAALLLSSCRDAAHPFDTDDYGPVSDSVAVRLTWNTRHDQAPIWSANGDSIYYSAGSFPGLGITTEGVLLGVPRQGGAVRVLLPAVQVGVSVSRFFTGAALSSDGRRIAFFDLTLVQPTRCDALQCSADPGPMSEPLLARGRLRVRNLAATGGDDAGLDILFRGRAFDPARALPFGLTLLDDLPFQHRFTESRQPSFRPSWSPDGQRLVFSDGVQLLLWQPGGEPTPIAGTQDGVWPAWSPDGQWIAYTRLAPGTAETINCGCYVSPRGELVLVEVQERTVYSGRSETGTLTLIRPDGSGKRELGAGDAPAWLPDNSALVVARSQSLWRVRADNATATEIPHTQRGASPAVSPDGRYLAFARLNQGLDWNIWVLRLDGAP